MEARPQDAMLAADLSAEEVSEMLAYNCDDERSRP